MHAGESDRSVAVVDQLPVLGGLSATRAWVPAAPNHLLAVGAMDDMLTVQTTLTEELGLKKYGYHRSTGPAGRARQLRAAVTLSRCYRKARSIGVTNKVAMFPANGGNVAAFKIDFAVGGRIDYPKAAAERRDGFALPRTSRTGSSRKAAISTSP